MCQLLSTFSRSGSSKGWQIAARCSSDNDLKKVAARVSDFEPGVGAAEPMPGRMIPPADTAARPPRPVFRNSRRDTARDWEELMFSILHASTRKGQPRSALGFCIPPEDGQEPQSA